jgi:hypothetical protein
MQLEDVIDTVRLYPISPTELMRTLDRPIPLHHELFRREV